jgi:hypothetical protein
MKDLIITTTKFENLPRELYEEYLSQIKLLKINGMTYDEWNIDMSHTMNHIENWKLNKDTDLLINYKDKFYSNLPIYFFNTSDKYSYFLRQDYLNKLLEILEKNVIVLPLNNLFDMFKKLNLQPMKNINLIVSDGLGNRLFQIASMYSIAKQNNYSLCLHILPNKHSKHQYKHITDKFVKKDISAKNIPLLRENSQFTFDRDITLIENILKYEDVCVAGCFQCSSYFLEYKCDIIDMFSIPIHLDCYLDSVYPLIHNSWFLHVRLTDYINSQNKNKHFIDLTDYYKTHLDSVSINDNIYLFSDDSYANVLEYYPLIASYPNISYINIEDELTTFYMMLKCKKGGICANSTFSWWAGYLNKNENKIIHKPSKMINHFNGKFNL